MSGQEVAAGVESAAPGQEVRVCPACGDRSDAEWWTPACEREWTRVQEERRARVRRLEAENVAVDADAARLATLPRRRRRP